MQLSKLVRLLLFAIAHASLVICGAGDSVNGEPMSTSSSSIMIDSNVAVVVASHQGISLPGMKDGTSDIAADTNLARVTDLKHGPQVAGEGDKVASEGDQVQNSDAVPNTNVAWIVNIKQATEVAGEAAEMQRSEIIVDANLAWAVDAKQGDEIAAEGDQVQHSGIVADTNRTKTVDAEQGAKADRGHSRGIVTDGNLARVVDHEVVADGTEIAAEAANTSDSDTVIDTNFARVVGANQGINADADKEDTGAADGVQVPSAEIVSDINLARVVNLKQGAEVAVKPAGEVESAVVEADTHLEAFVASDTSADNGTTGASGADSKEQVCCRTITTGNGSSSRHVQFAIRDGHEKSRGVNLGGWLVAEHWMTKDSEIWWGVSNEDADCGEYTAMTKTTRELAMQRAKAHRDHFITETDIQKIASTGLNTVRVPVGFWIVGFDDHDPSNQKQWQVYAPHGLDYLDKLIRDWAKEYNVAVLISMHAAKGSQNGADHSSPQVKGQSYWAAYPENIASTLDAVRFLANRYKKDDAFLGIGLLNEPAGSTSTTQLYKYYEDAYRLIRVEDKNDCVLAISPLLWEQSPDHMTELLHYATNIWVEWHRYFVWGYEDTSENDLLTKSIPAFRDNVERWKTKSDKKLFIGEFSFATSKAQFSDFTNKSRVREYAQAQMDVLVQTVDGGWTFWTWRIDGDDKPNELSRWSLRNMIENGIFPNLPRGNV